MKFQKTVCILLTVFMCLSLCGCTFVDNTEELVSPPELTGYMYPIGQALKSSAAKDYKLEYPTSGNHRSAIILEDINNDAVFVSIHSLHKLSKYKGREGDAPTLNKIGSGAWERVKQRTKSKIKDIARDLIKLYAERNQEKGFAYD